MYSCNKNTREDQLLETLVDLEQAVFPGEELPAETIDEIRASIRLYKTEIAAEVRETEQLSLLYKRLAKKYMEIADINKQIAQLTVPGFSHEPGSDDPAYLKILAVKSLDSQLYRKAYTGLQEAIKINSGNAIFYYLAGLSAGWIGKSELESARLSEREKWFGIAENYYKRAIEIKPDYVDALYALAVLIVFETGGSLAEAEKYTTAVLAREKYNTDAMFLAAIIYDEQGEYPRAVQQYKNIIAVTKSEEIKDQAGYLMELVKEKLYESE